MRAYVWKLTRNLFRRRRRLAGRYELLEELGSGGAGTVYKALDERTNRLVAVKVLHSFLSRQRDYVERFRREAQIALTLDSQHIVRVLDFGEEEDTFFLIMEYVEGADLERLRKPFQVKGALRIIAQVARALEEAHGKGIVHRDIKPQNIIVQPDGNVKVADLGIAREEGVGTRPMGSYRYSAPETFRGEVDARSDIYSLGVVLYELLAGKMPFSGETPAEAMRQHLDDEPAPLRGSLPDLDPEIARLVAQCLVKDRNQRPQSALEVRRAMETLLDAQPESLEMGAGRERQPLPSLSSLSWAVRPLSKLASPFAKGSGRARGMRIDYGRHPARLGLVMLLAALLLIVPIAYVAYVALDSIGNGPPGAFVEKTPSPSTTEPITDPSPPATEPITGLTPPPPSELFPSAKVEIDEEGVEHTFRPSVSEQFLRDLDSDGGTELVIFSIWRLSEGEAEPPSGMRSFGQLDVFDHQDEIWINIFSKRVGWVGDGKLDVDDFVSIRGLEIVWDVRIVGAGCNGEELYILGQKSGRLTTLLHEQLGGLNCAPQPPTIEYNRVVTYREIPSGSYLGYAITVYNWDPTSNSYEVVDNPLEAFLSFEKERGILPLAPRSEEKSADEIVQDSFNMMYLKEFDNYLLIIRRGHLPETQKIAENTLLERLGGKLEVLCDLNVEVVLAKGVAGPLAQGRPLELCQ